jgi:hypothetical protein
MRLIRYYIREALRYNRLISEADGGDDPSFMEQLGKSTVENLFAPESFKELLRGALNLKDAAAAVATEYIEQEEKNELQLAAAAAAYVVTNQDRIITDIDEPILDMLNNSGDEIDDYDSVYMRAKYLNELLIKDFEGVAAGGGANPLYPYRTALFLTAYSYKIPVGTVLSSGEAAVATLFTTAASLLSIRASSTQTSLEDMEKDEEATAMKALAMAVAGGGGALAAHLVAHEVIGKVVKFLARTVGRSLSEPWFANQLKGIVNNRAAFRELFASLRTLSAPLNENVGVSDIASNVNLLYRATMRSLEDGVWYRGFTARLSRLGDVSTAIKAFCEDGKVTAIVYREVPGTVGKEAIGTVTFDARKLFSDVPGTYSGPPSRSDLDDPAGFVMWSPQPAYAGGKTEAEILAKQKTSQAKPGVVDKLKSAAATAATPRTTEIPETGWLKVPAWIANAISGASYRKPPTTTFKWNEDVGEAFVEEVIRRASAWVFQSRQTGTRDTSLKSLGGMLTKGGPVEELLKGPNGYSQLFSDIFKTKSPPGFEELDAATLEQFKIIAAIMDAAKAEDEGVFGQVMGKRVTKLVEDGAATYTPNAGKESLILQEGDKLTFEPATSPAGLRDAASKSAKDLGEAASDFENAMWSATNNFFPVVLRWVKGGSLFAGRTLMAVFGVGALKGFISDTFGLNDVQVTPETFKVLLNDAEIRRTTVGAFQKIRTEEGALNASLDIGSDDKRVIPLKDADDFLMSLLETKVGDEDPNGAFNPDNFQIAAQKYEAAMAASVALINQLEREGKR